MKNIGAGLLTGTLSIWCCYTLLLARDNTYARAESWKDKYGDTTICALAEHPEEFDGKFVRVHGVVQSDGLENTGLADGNCKGKGVALWVSHESERGDRTVLALEEAIMRLGFPGTSENKRISGTFFGKFESRRSALPSRLLRLERLSELRIEMDAD